MFAVDVQQESAATVIRLRGEIDLGVAPEIERALGEGFAGASDRPLAIDLTEVSFADSTTLRLLLDADRRAGEEGRALRVVVGQGPVLQLLALTRVLEDLDVDVREG